MIAVGSIWRIDTRNSVDLRNATFERNRTPCTLVHTHTHARQHDIAVCYTIIIIADKTTWEKKKKKKRREGDRGGSALARRKINDVYIIWNCQFLSIGRSLEWLMTYHLVGSAKPPGAAHLWSDKSLKLPAPSRCTWCIVIGSPAMGQRGKKKKNRLQNTAAAAAAADSTRRPWRTRGRARVRKYTGVNVFLIFWIFV